MATTAERIKQLRKRKGLSQAELAEQTGVKNNTVSTWERGTRKPDFDALNKLSDIFEVPYEYILGNSDDETLPPKSTEEELDAMALSALADEVRETLKKYCRLSLKSQKLVDTLISKAYIIERQNGELKPDDPFEITVLPNERYNKE